MKKLKTSLLVLSLFTVAPFLATNSYASTSSELEHCSPYYHQVMSQPLITLEKAMVTDVEKAKEIETASQFVDEYVMNVDIANLPSNIDLDYYENDDIQQTLASGHFVSSENAQQAVLSLAGTYYFGHYVPKDEPRAVVYLQKIVDYYEQEHPKDTEELYLRVMMAIASGVVEDDTTLTDEYFNLATSKALIAAGSLDTEALVINADFKNSEGACFEPLLTKLENLANQGSIYAIDKVDKTYTKLYKDNPEKYNSKMEYWQQRAEEKGL